MKAAVAVVALGLLAAPAVAGAQEEGHHTHDGFFLQLDMGVGGLRSTVPVTTFEDGRISGVARNYSIVVGGALVENLILAGHFWGASADRPGQRLGAQDLDDLDGSSILSALGVNLTYYFMPLNLYVSASPSFTVLGFEEDGDLDATDGGFGVRLAVGKEWWVSKNWGLGLNAQLALSRNQSSNDFDPPTWRTGWFGLAFSATYN